jgi:hypothetical protein
MATLYVRRSTQIARTPGFCLICDEPVMTGDSIAILAYGAKAGDWGKAHPECADASQFVINPETAKLAAVAAVAEPPHDDPISAEVDYIELPKGQYKGFDKYAVRLKGKPVWFTSDRRRAEGAVAFHQSLDVHSRKTVYSEAN